MTDQADALAGKLADVPKRHSVECRARGGDPCECFGYPDYDAMVVVATAHFAEEIAKVAEATLARVREGLTRERIAEAIYNVLIPHEYKMSLEEAHSLRSERLGRGTETTRECYALADAILALLAPEGK